MELLPGLFGLHFEVQAALYRRHRMPYILKELVNDSAPLNLVTPVNALVHQVELGLGEQIVLERPLGEHDLVLAVAAPVGHGLDEVLVVLEHPLHVERGQALEDGVAARRPRVVLGEQHEQDVVDAHRLVDDHGLGAAVVGVRLHDELLDVGLFELLQRYADQLGLVLVGLLLLDTAKQGGMLERCWI